MQKIIGNKDGHCPLCDDENLDYSFAQHTDGTLKKLPYICLWCGANGTAVYNAADEFVTHENVCTKGGDFVENFDLSAINNTEEKGFLGCNFDKYKVCGQDCVNIGRSFEYGGCEYEFSIEWICLQRNLVPCLQIFDDAWKGLYAEHIPLLKALADNDSKNLSLKEMKKLLNKLGYKDTDRRLECFK